MPTITSAITSKLKTQCHDGSGAWVWDMSTGVRDIAKAKATLRGEMLAARRQYLQTRGKWAAEAVAAQLRNHPVFVAARHVHCFLSMPEELATGPIFDLCRELGKHTSVPVMLKDERRLGYVSWSSGQPLQKVAFGVMEPPRENWRTDLAALDLVLVPGLAFDAQGGRLGYGKAYYDGFLAELRAKQGKGNRASFVGLLTTVQLVERIPVDSWDIAMDWLITEDGCLNTADSRI